MLLQYMLLNSLKRSFIIVETFPLRCYTTWCHRRRIITSLIWLLRINFVSQNWATILWIHTLKQTIFVRLYYICMNRFQFFGVSKNQVKKYDQNSLKPLLRKTMKNLTNNFSSEFRLTLKTSNNDLKLFDLPLESSKRNKILFHWP